jgi:hypothetical protein
MASGLLRPLFFEGGLVSGGRGGTAPGAPAGRGGAAAVRAPAAVAGGWGGAAFAAAAGSGRPAAFRAAPFAGAAAAGAAFFGAGAGRRAALVREALGFAFLREELVIARGG